jgi:hypothetical protein
VIVPKYFARPGSGSIIFARVVGVSPSLRWRTMAFIPGYKHDILIIYAHPDEMPIEGPRVSTFVEELRASVAVRLGRADANSILMVRELGGVVAFQNAFLENVKLSAALVIIMSPAYLQSTWCFTHAQILEDIGNKADANRRVFVVETLPTNRNFLAKLV